MPEKVHYGKQLQQWVELARPAAGGRRPTVIFVHGGGWVGGGTAMWRSESAYWVAHGWVGVNSSYRFSTSKTASYSYGRNMLADMGSILALTRSLPYVDRNRILVVGDSAGGHLAAYMATRYHGRVAGMILWSPVAAPIVAVQTGERWSSALGCPTVCLQQRSLAARASKLFGYSARTTNPLSYLGRYGPVPTWVAGSAKEWVPFDANGGALCAASAHHCARHLVPGTLHATKLRDANRSLLISARHWAAETVAVKRF